MRDSGEAHEPDGDAPVTYAIDRQGIAHRQLPRLLETVCGRKRRHNRRWSWSVGACPLRKLCGKCEAVS